MPGLNLLIKIEFVPYDSSACFTAVSTPLMIEDINITVMTPIITPTTVRKERSLFARKVAKAIFRFSKLSLRINFMCYSIRSQSLNGIQTRCLPRRKHARKYADRPGYADSKNTRAHR